MRTSLTGIKTSSSKRLPSAFTLIELLIVLVALVVLASAVVPALRNAGHQQDLAELADRVAASARFGRDEAVARQVPIVLTAGPAAVQLAVDASGVTTMMGLPGPGMAGPMPGGAGGGERLLRLPAAAALVPLPPRFQARLEALPESFNGSPAGTPASGSALDALRFPPDGRTLGGMLQLTDDRGHTLLVVVTPGTGVVRIEAAHD